MITVASCSDNKCSQTIVSATPTLTTETRNGETTVYTTYCPLITDNVSTKMITITSCSKNKCSETVVAATPTLTTETNNGETTVYTTYCPLTGATETASTTTITISTCSNNKCSLTAVPATPSVATITTNGYINIYTTYCQISVSSDDITTIEENRNTFVTTLTNAADPTAVTTITEALSTYVNTLSQSSIASVTGPAVIVPEYGAASMKSTFVFAYWLLSMIPFLI